MTPHKTVSIFKHFTSFPPDPGVSVTSSSFEIDSLSGGLIKVGDHKKPNSFSYETRKQTPYLGTRIQSYKGKDTQIESGQIETGNIENYLISLPPYKELTNSYNVALSRLNDQIRGGLDISVDLAESHQALRMVNLAARSVSFWRHIDRRLFAASKREWRKSKGLIVDPLSAGSTLKEVLRAAGGSWLEYTYGWKPLASSLYGAATELHQQVLPRKLKFRSSSSENYELKLANSLGPPPVLARGLNGTKMYVTMKPRQGFELARWTSLNPVSIAWELMPYSFVVDWFYNVGDYLRSLETALAYDNAFDSGFYTQLSVCNMDHNVAFNSGTSTVPVRNAFRSSSNRVFFSRSLFGSYPLPQLPVIKANLGSSRLLSAASLLAQHLR